MFEIIQAVRPDYIIGENVPGLLSIEGGMVFEQVCLDLESEGYEVQAFVLPACATGAPHRRDRVWIVAYSNEVRRCSGLGSIPKENGEISQRNENAKFSNTDSGATSNTESGRRGRLRNESEATGAREGNQLLGGELAVSLTPDTNEVRLQQCENRGEMGGGQAEICGTGGESSNAIEANGKVETTTNSTSNGHSGGCTETGGEKRESEQRGVLEFEGADSWIASDTQQIRHRGCSNANGIGTEREVHHDFGHDRNGIRSEIEGCDRTTQNSGSSGCEHGINDEQGDIGKFGKFGTGGNERDIDAEVNSNTNESGLRRESNTQQQSAGVTGNYWHDWPSLSPFHSGHDGLSPELVRHIRTSLAEAGETPENIEAYIRKEANWLRKQAIMAAGNAVVPTVVLQVMKAIQNHYENTNH
jgi:site-specific DNA-cytosine methylase